MKKQQIRGEARSKVKSPRAAFKRQVAKEPREPEYDPDEYVEWVECWDCAGDGVTHHDCGEDTCCCLEPIDNVTCSTCEGKGGWERAEKESAK